MAGAALGRIVHLVLELLAELARDKLRDRQVVELGLARTLYFSPSVPFLSVNMTAAAMLRVDVKRVPAFTAPLYAWIVIVSPSRIF